MENKIKWNVYCYYTWIEPTYKRFCSQLLLLLIFLLKPLLHVFIISSGNMILSCVVCVYSYCVNQQANNWHSTYSFPPHFSVRAGNKQLGGSI